MSTMAERLTVCERYGIEGEDRAIVLGEPPWKRRRAQMLARSAALRDLHANFYTGLSCRAAAIEVKRDMRSLRYRSPGYVQPRNLVGKAEALLRAIDLGADIISSERIEDILNGRVP